MITVPTSSEGVQAGRSSGSSNFVPPDEYEDLRDEKPNEEGHSDGDTDKFSGGENVEGDFTKLTGRKKKLFEIRLKMVIFYIFFLKSNYQLLSYIKS